MENANKDAYILDVGCGRGFLLKKLKEMGYKNIYGLDPSEFAVNELREAGISAERNSVYNIIPAFNDKFDIITFTTVIEHINHYSKNHLDAFFLKRGFKSIFDKNYKMWIGN